MSSVSITPQERPNLLRELTCATRTEAKRWIGRGEAAGKNNQGADIERYRRMDGTGKPTGGAGSWCAAFASAMLLTAANELELRLPFETHRGAKQLTRNVGRSCRFVVQPRRWINRWRRYDGEPAGLVNAILAAWHRGKNPRERWKGHVEIILDYLPGSDTLITLPGNVVPRGRDLERLLERLSWTPQPGQAVPFVRHHKHGSWRQKLYAIASLI